MPLSGIAVTEQVFTRFGEGDVDGICEWLADDVYIQFYGPAVIPYAGEYRGRDKARGFFETVLRSVDIHLFEPEQFLSDGDIVTVTGKLHLTARATGVDFRSDFAHVITIRNERWHRFRDFMDTSEAVRAFSAMQC